MPDSAGLLGTLGIDWKLFLAQLVNFAVLLFVLWKFAYTPLLKKMDEREKKIRDGLEFSKDAEQKMKEAETERKGILRTANADARKMIEEAEKRAEALQREQAEKTKQELARIADEHRAQLNAEREAAMKGVKGEIADLVTLGIRKALEGIDEKTQEKLIQRAYEQTRRLS